MIESMKLRSVQLVQLHILNKVDELCTKHGIKYYLIGGTLLGAVRHKGFIPWDDDIDIAMYRDDYEKFIVIAQKELKPDLFVHNYKTDKRYNRYMTKIRANGTRQVEHYIAHIDMNHGIFIDIFPLDHIVKSHGLVINLRGLIINYMFRIMKNKIINKDNKTYSKSLLKRMLSKLSNFVPNYFANWLLEFVCIMSNNKHGNLTTSFASIYGWKKQTVPNEVYGEGVRLSFEGHQFWAPTQYEVLLHQLFGDYLKLPPIEKQTGHAIIDVHLGKYEKEIIKKIQLEQNAKDI